MHHFSFSKLLIVSFFIACTGGFVAQARADEIHPGVYLIVDTSGSMTRTVGNLKAYGDGSVEHPHETGTTSRIYIAKEAVNTVVNAYGDVLWGFARFTQDVGNDIYCACEDQGSVNAGETGTCQYYTFSHDLPGVMDDVCINYLGTCDGADVLVPIGGSINEILSWIDHHEYNPPAPIDDGSDPELRGIGGTPLGGSLIDIRTQLSADIASDSLRGCRPYTVILLTDGEESCSGDPVSAAANLRVTPNNSETCSIDSDCDSGNCSSGVCVYDVRTYVIAFATDASAKAAADGIAAAGGTTSAIEANNEDDLVAAMASIIASSIKPEYCNGVDDDCDGDIDEDFPVSDPCDNGLLGECFQTGNYVCSADETGVECTASEIAPVAEICNDLDDDCNGLVDDVPGGCPEPGPEMCNGLDDDLDGTTSDDGEDDPGAGVICGTDEGICEAGITKCIAGSIECCADDGLGTCTAIQQPQEEICDTLDNDCDGQINEGVNTYCYPGGYEGCTEDPPGSGSFNCVGICSAGISQCDIAGNWSSCSGYLIPQAEVCDGVDNDCDDSIDEELGSTNCGFGICEHTVSNCDGGASQSCDPMEGAASEECNNLDDDCDGQIDDGLVQTCYTGSAGTEGVGVCIGGNEICSGGSWGSCNGEVKPSTEVCNGLDDDCNGLNDDNVERTCYTGPAGTEGVGVCTGGNQSCSGGSWSVCNGEVKPGSEVCNTLDDDCNGSVDDMGSTTCGLGVCEHTVLNCDGGSAQSCDPMAGSSAEICDGLDNDCDGNIDGFSVSCYPTGFSGCTETSPGVYSCDGICSSGLQVCTAGAFGSCTGAIIPQPEVCDGVDNDCDTQIDEELGSTTCGLGVCEHTVQNCVGGSAQSCDSMAGSSPEICDGLDNDCDGQVDEGLAQGCYPTGASGCTETSPGVFSCDGICQAGTSVCSAGSWGSCQGSIISDAEVCNGLDDDCNGLIDDNVERTCYTGPAGTEGTGVCTRGNQSCSGGSWSVCNGEVKPSTEVCNGLDDDCNSTIDDMGSTTCGLGVCEHTVQNCASGTSQTCDPMAGSSAEICDGLDNDCDGQVDGLSSGCYPAGDSGCSWDSGSGSYVCEGTCSPGLQFCPVNGTGTWGVCQGASTPVEEFCDSLDNDCDGQVDEDLEQFCYPPGSGSNTGCEETGDGSWLCTGECTVGLRQCSGGSWSSCLGLAVPTSEICDGLDNDCDGEIDEDTDIPGMGEPCGGVGVCAPGIRACINGQVVCEGGGEPQPGLCDGLDNNCNGLVDESDEVADDSAMGAPCGDTMGECQQGQNECIDGEVVCVGGVVPTEEICNGLDDNCDGVVDNGELCSGNEICYEADCRPLCDPSVEQSCGAGYSCIEVDLSEENGGGTEDICYPQLAPCSGVYCSENEVCREGACLNPCLAEPCADYESCIVNRYSGQVGHESEPEYYCVDSSCSSATVNCPSGKLCIEHECVADPCSALACEYGSEYCVRSGCESGSSECTASCSPIPYCDSHEKWDAGSESCVSDSCFEVDCESGELCLDGSCEPNPCLSVYCDQGQQCVGGECISDPCAKLSCPFYTSCHIDPLDGSAWCQPNEGIWEPGVKGDSMTTTGGGLFSCSSSSSGSGHSGGYSGVLLLFLLLLAYRFRSFLQFSFLAKVRGRGSLVISGLLLTGLLFTTGCDYKEYTLSEEGHLDIPDAGTDADADIEEDVDSCVSSEEVCDDVDNDCNGIVDDYWTNEEGGEGHFSDDIFNCGSCGNICAFMHADAQCVDGSCTMGDCDTNWYDFNNDSSDGCEQSCVISSGGQEICDGVDNDCNGIIDDYWSPSGEGGQGHFLDDPMNCGECGRVCAFPNGEGSCDSGDCVLSSCQAGYADADGAPGNGCECIITGTDDSTCDGVDNDCDGQIDEDSGGEECYAGTGCVDNGDGSFSCTGQCSTGSAVCSGGQTLCQGQTGPELEICDGLDNDCDGQTDEGYDLQVDVSNCGSCGNQCSLPQAVTRCEVGNCVISFCSQNYHDLNGLAADGCEYNCTLSNGGIERCDDSIDNDCDGTVDEFNSASDVNNCGSCGYSCASNAPSNMDVTGCSSGVCQYSCANDYYDYDGNGTNGCEYFCSESNGGVEVCDGADNNCDGQTDEGFDKETDVNNCGSCGYSCSANAPDYMQVTGCSGGVCQYSCQGGYYNLDGIQSNGCEYSCTVSSGGVEICDGLDNDCNGQTDEDGAGLPLTQSCYTGPGGTEGSGLCSSGTQTCSEGGWGSCLGETLPGTESCDGLDNDCDGSIDEDFNQNTDILNCGSCGNSCFSSAPANTNATGCSVGVCQYSCKLNYYDRNGNILSDGCEEFCELTNGGVERCDDGIDNDCDGVVDEFDGDNDINNCGSCGYSCSSNAPDYMDVTGCSGGVCQYVCASNYHDLDGSSSNGCEYYCSPSNGGTESCDGTDNDCDGNIDEGFDTNTDLNNCGSCGYSCSANAPDYMQVTGCSGGVCQYSCQSGYLNIDGLQSNGCEYSCTVSSGGVESCDGLDNDCDGQTDEDGAGLPLTQSCYTGPGGTQGVGICSSGTQTCGSGSWGSCLGETLPVSESCDGVDNDCDSATDEDFDQNTDILNCGGCGNSCFSSAPANTNATGCSAGACQYVCVSGYHDVNGDINNAMGDGCEYACDQAAPDGTEYCNGVDDDCDSLEDEASDLVSPPSGYCKTEGGCGAVVNSYCELFEGDKQWVCDYPAQVERMPGSPNEVAYYESLCDGYDNDCNGQVDEDFLPIKGDPCSDGDYGLCEGTGTVVCKVDLLGTECNITSKQSPQTEVCDGVDNDCDGKTDEGPWDAGSNPSYVEDEKETIIVNGYDVDIYKYEASRSTATLSSAGIGNTRSCSRVGVKPWNRVTYLQAQRACAKAGMRLCTADEWYTGCEGGSGYLYPYGNTYDGLDCNGDDYGVDDVINTGDANQCYNSTSLTWDMSGNLKEWTSEYRGQSELNKRLYTVRGGSFYDHGTGLTCDFTSSVYVENVFTDNVGFRCCTTCGNGTVEAGEQCDDGNQINGDGCDYLCASEAGQTCGNGVVEGSEECDDGNRIAGDGCSAACFDEPEPICGNGVIEADEDCDDGNTILNDGCEYCQITPICGDSTVETPEQCDDGNANDGDGCDSDCQWEPVHCGGQMDSYGYEMCTGTLGFSDIRGTGTKLGNADDEVYSFSISFNFNLYGSNYNSIDVNTNGNINFQSNSSWSNNALPSSTYTMVLSPLWDDLNSSNHATQGVWAQNFGSFPNRYTVIQWYTEHYSDSGEVMFEVILHENGDIDFIYNDVDFSNATYDDGADATVGIQGSSTAADGYYLQYSYNSASLSNGMSITFHHP